MSTASECELRGLAGEFGIPDMAVQILDAAMKLFASKGYAATSVREIVQEANVTNPMLYYYFDNKEGVFCKLIEILFGSFNTSVIEAIETANASLYDRLGALVRVHTNAGVESPVILRFVYSVLFGPSAARPEVDLFTHRMQIFGRVVELFDDAIERGEFVPREGFDSLFLTSQVFGLINHYLIMSLRRSDLLETSEAELSGSAVMELTGLEEIFDEHFIDKLLQFFFDGAGVLTDTKDSK